MALQFGFSTVRILAVVVSILLIATAAHGSSTEETVGVGMATDHGPGQLRLEFSEYSVVEGNRLLAVAVQRVNGSEGAISVTYRTADGSASALGNEDYVETQGTLNWGDNESQSKAILISLREDEEAEGSETFTVLLSTPTGGAVLSAPSTATVTIVDDDEDFIEPGQIRFVSTQFSANEAAGQRSISVERVGGTDGPVSVSFATSNGSATAGSDYGATSGTLEWADGEGGQMTFPVQVFDDAVDEGNETVNLNLSNPTGGAILGTSGATLTILDDDGEPGACVEDSTTLCLRADQRFRVQLEWQTAEGETGPGRVVPLAPDDSGLFYFFAPDNAELLVKVIDGCSLNDHFWVFAAAATDVEYTLTVTDTQTNVVSVYNNDLGRPAPAITDTQAFATCP